MMLLMGDVLLVVDDDFVWFDVVLLGEFVFVLVVELCFVGILVVVFDWDVLVVCVVDCMLCCLCEKWINIVFGVGDCEVDWMLIGEVLGENEDK